MGLKRIYVVMKFSATALPTTLYKFTRAGLKLTTFACQHAIVQFYRADVLRLRSHVQNVSTFLR